jgi:uncharacterized protein YkwD
MTRFRLFMLSLAAVVVLAITLLSNFQPSAKSVASFTPPGRKVLASAPELFAVGKNIEPRGETEGNQSDKIDGVSPAPAQTAQTAKKSSTPAAITPAKNNPITSRPAVAPGCSGSFTQEFMCLFNQYRASKGLGKVSYNQALAGVALKHSQWMDSTGIFSHEESDGSHLLDRCRAAGIVCRGENLAKGVSSAQNLLNMWVASPSHNKNLLGPYTTAGLGISGNYITLLLN